MHARSRSSLRWMTAVAAALAALAMPAARASGQGIGQPPADGAPRDVSEATYAASIAQVADSAIRRLDFFPTRAQLRVQMLFLAPRDSAVAVFYEIARRSLAAAQQVDEISARFERTAVPEDLAALHRDLVTSLRAARSAADRLSASANACQVDPSSVTRCQSSFTAASSAMAQAYSRYLEVRERIARQVLDTRTVLPRFLASGR